SNGFIKRTRQEPEANTALVSACISSAILSLTTTAQLQQTALSAREQHLQLNSRKIERNELNGQTATQKNHLHQYPKCFVIYFDADTIPAAVSAAIFNAGFI